MLIIKKGNLLEATENIICHQCNLDISFGGGIALQIKNKYPKIEDYILDYYSLAKIELGDICHYCTHDTYSIMNCFTQNKDFTTNYPSLKKAFKNIKKFCKETNYSVAMPYKYGCGIAKGNWEEVESILLDIFTDYDITIYKLEV